MTINLGRSVKCRFCKRDILVRDLRLHLRVMHPQIVKEKLQEVERVESIPENHLLTLFTEMEILLEDSRFNISSTDLLAQDIIEGKEVREIDECDGCNACCETVCPEKKED